MPPDRYGTQPPRPPPIPHSIPWRRAKIPGANGIATARGMARIYGAVVNDEGVGGAPEKIVDMAGSHIMLAVHDPSSLVAEDVLNATLILPGRAARFGPLGQTKLGFLRPVPLRDLQPNGAPAAFAAVGKPPCFRLRLGMLQIHEQNRPLFFVVARRKMNDMAVGNNNVFPTVVVHVGKHGSKADKIGADKSQSRLPSVKRE